MCWGVLYRRVDAVCASVAAPTWHDRLNHAATLLAVLAGIDVLVHRTETGIPESSDCSGFPRFSRHPIVEPVESSRLLEWSTGLPDMALVNPYDPPTPWPGGDLPSDLTDLLGAADNLCDRRKLALNGALTAYQTGLALKRTFPTLAVCAFLSAMERMSSYHGREGPREACPSCGLRRPTTRDALVGLFTELGDPELVDVPRVKSAIKRCYNEVRHKWTHGGEQFLGDLVPVPEISSVQRRDVGPTLGDSQELARWLILRSFLRDTAQGVGSTELSNRPCAGSSARALQTTRGGEDDS